MITIGVDRVLPIARTLDNSALLGAIWDAKGSILHTRFLNGDRSEEPKDALAFFEKGLALRKETNDTSGAARSLLRRIVSFGNGH